jgi:hypothetical protein
VKQQATKRRPEAGERRANRAQPAASMAHAAKSPPKAIPVPTMAKRQWRLYGDVTSDG